MECDWGANIGMGICDTISILELKKTLSQKGAKLCAVAKTGTKMVSSIVVALSFR